MRFCFKVLNFFTDTPIVYSPQIYYKNTMKNKRSSLFSVLIIYLAAFGAAVALLQALPPATHPLSALLLADILATGIVFISNLALKNASVYDPYWSVQPLFLIGAMYFFYEITFQLPHLLILIPILIWSIRLTANWASGFENFEWEDWRYKMLKSRNPKYAQLIVFFGVMLMPTILVFLGTLPVWYILQAETVNLIILEIGGLLIILGAFFEHSADTAMKRYKENPDRPPYIDTGLWRYSRHPNYLGEILIWIGIFTASLVNFHPLSAVGVTLITALFKFISIPMMEKHILEKHPEYAGYQKTVRPLIFGPRRNRTRDPHLQ